MIRNQFKGTVMIAYKTKHEKEKRSRAGRPERKVQSVAKTSHSLCDSTFLHAVTKLWFPCLPAFAVTGNLENAEPPIDSIKLYTQSWPLILSLIWSVQPAATLQLTLHPQCPDPRRLGGFSGLGGLCRYFSAWLCSVGSPFLSS